MSSRRKVKFRYKIDIFKRSLMMNIERFLSSSSFQFLFNKHSNEKKKKRSYTETVNKTSPTSQLTFFSEGKEVARLEVKSLKFQINVINIDFFHIFIIFFFPLNFRELSKFLIKYLKIKYKSHCIECD